MTDYTAEITALQRERIEMQAEKASNRVTIRARYAERIRQEIADADEAAEIRFARLLSQAVAAGVPQSLIRKEVLRTNTWSIWTYWRDLAEIEPERVVVQDAKKAREAADSPFRWASDYSTLTVVKNSVGAEIEPVVYDMSTNRYVAGSEIWWPETGTPEQHGVSTEERAAVEKDKKFRAFVSDEIQRKIDSGEIQE